MRYARMRLGYRLATSAFTMRRATPVAKRYNAAPVCTVSSPGWCAGRVAPWSDEAHLTAVIATARRATTRPALFEPRCTEASQRERHAKTPSAAFEEWEIEAVEIVILDHVRVRCLNRGREAANEVGLTG